MGFSDLIKSLFGGVAEESADPARKTVKVGHNSYTPVSTGAQLNRIAWRLCKEYIASAVSKVEIRTFREGTEIFGEEYYRWNIRPNVNQTSTEFWQRAAEKYFEEGRLLIIPVGDQLVIADSWNRKSYALMPAAFSDVVVGDFRFGKVFFADDVMYFENPDGDSIKAMITGAEQLIDRTLAEAVEKYRLDGGERGTLEIDSMQMGTDEEQEELEQLLNEDFANYFGSKNAVIPLYDGIKYTPLSHGNAQKTSIVGDIKSLLNLSIEVAAQAMKIPPVLILGTVADSKTAVQNFLTFCIDPFMNMITEGANACLCGKEVLKGTYITADSSYIEHADIFSLAEKSYKLIAASVMNTNEIRRKLSEPRINAEWADEYARTKNYETVNTMGKEETGYDGNEDENNGADEG